ncbi:Mg-chelatase subunit ChlD [Paenibacillus endophyticus]|uniref:Mg-chelatase subunit ChlD n=1 Tax=Paenibacillus endophyticus TaxID=1294268 RepID=A0A7W5GD90_9BACL|nr:vWA domain-containing protein [Paenibacillus endophyticus]MBB3154767.1 Mg-chelatase subunit ChlD [Paenibacillus endophyticus]
MNRLKRATRQLILASAICLLSISSLSIAHAAQGTSRIDAVLVLDVSNSMSKSDPGKIGNEAMKMFIDMLSTKGDQVGIVAYTDEIQREKALLEIESAADKTNLKGFIDQLNRGAYTDVSVGVKEAVQILEDGADPAHEPMIILLADGNNDFDDASGRTQAQSDADMDKAIQEANDSGVPIYTIGLNADGKLNKEALAELSDLTGGKSFSTDSADDLPQILSEIFASHLDLNVVPVDSFTADGNYQNVKISVPNANVLEANISIMSSKPVEAKLIDPSGNSVAIPSDDILLSKSKSYSLIKLLTPVEGDWTLQVKGVNRDKIDINLIFNYDLGLAIDPLAQTSYSKGDAVTVRSYLISGGQKLKDEEQYSNMSAVLLVKDLDTGTTKEVPMDNGGDHFEGTYKIEDEHDYEIKVKAEEESFFRETEALAITAKRAGSGQATPNQPAVEEKKPFPVVPVILGVIGLAAVLAAAFFILRLLKKANRGFVGQLIIEIRDENTGDKTSPQYKKLSAFKGKLLLHQLLQLAPELKETEKVLFKPGSNDRIVLQNASLCTIEKAGRTIDASREFEMKSGDSITVSLKQVDKTIFIEYLV